MFKKLRNYLFRKEYAELEKKRLALELKETTFKPDIVSLTRQLLKGFNPKVVTASLYDDADTAIDVLLADGRDKSEEAQLAFLSKIADARGNQPLMDVMDHIVRNQILFSVKSAPTLESMNFGRATINGVSLVKDEMERLTAIYKERKTPEEKFDDKKVL